jgi:hypothetical protein
MRKGSESVCDKWNISWSYEAQIFHSSKLSYGGDRKTFEVMTLASLLSEALYQGNPNRTI